MENKDKENPVNPIEIAIQSDETGMIVKGGKVSQDLEKRECE